MLFNLLYLFNFQNCLKNIKLTFGYYFYCAIYTFVTDKKFAEVRKWYGNYVHLSPLFVIKTKLSTEFSNFLINIQLINI